MILGMSLLLISPRRELFKNKLRRGFLILRQVIKRRSNPKVFESFFLDCHVTHSSLLATTCFRQCKQL